MRRPTTAGSQRQRLLAARPRPHPRRPSTAPVQATAAERAAPVAARRAYRRAGPGRPPGRRPAAVRPARVSRGRRSALSARPGGPVAPAGAPLRPGQRAARGAALVAGRAASRLRRRGRGRSPAWSILTGGGSRHVLERSSQRIGSSAPAVTSRAVRRADRRGQPSTVTVAVLNGTDHAPAGRPRVAQLGCRRLQEGSGHHRRRTRPGQRRSSPTCAGRQARRAARSPRRSKLGPSVVQPIDSATQAVACSASAIGLHAPVVVTVGDRPRHAAVATDDRAQICSTSRSGAPSRGARGSPTCSTAGCRSPRSTGWSRSPASSSTSSSSAGARALATGNLERKLERYREHGIPVVLGGTLTELAIAQGRLDRARSPGCTSSGSQHIEISDGTIALEHEHKLELIERLAEEFTVLSEVGSKDDTADHGRPTGGSSRSRPSSPPAPGR